MINAVHAVRTLIGIAFRVDPLRTGLVLLLMPMVGGATALSGISVRWMVDSAVAHDGAGMVWAAVLLTGTILIVYQLAVMGAEIKLALQAKVGHEIDQRTMIMCASLPRIDQHEDPAYLDRLELLRYRRVELSGAFGAMVENIRAFVELGAVVVLLATLHPALIMLPLAAVPIVLANRLRERLIARADQEVATVSRFGEALMELGCDSSAAREIRIYGLAGEIRDRHAAAVDRTRRRRDQAETRGTLAVTAGWTVFAGGLGATVVWVVTAAMSGRASAGDVALAVTVGGQLAGAVTGIVLLLGWLSTALRALAGYLWLVDHARRAGGQGQRATLIPARGDLVLDSVSFRYPGTDRPVLTDISLRFPEGATVALVGENGAGKSTLVKLLCKLYEPTTGHISYGGQPLDQLAVDQWRSQLSTCFQDFCRFEFPVRESVGIGALQGTRNLPILPSDQAILGAVQAAGAHKWVQSMTDGLNTHLGTAFADGFQPSTGQWQKIALARAGMRPEPAVMILDEPAASLDPISEHALVEHYIRKVRIASPRTIIVLISHRFSTVRHADLIVVLEHGELREIGSHAELVALRGRYAELHELHAGYYRPSTAPSTR